MSRRVKFTPQRNEATGKWRVNIPAKYSETGKRQRIEFETLALAMLEGKRRQAEIKMNGQNAAPIQADRATEANKCYDLIERHNVTLTQIVKEWLELKAAQADSITLDQAFLNTIGLREKELKHKSTLRDYKLTHKILPPTLLNKKVCDITLKECSKALDGTTDSPAMYNKYRSYLRAVFSEAERDGYANKNPAKKTRKRDTGHKKVEIATVEEINKIFAACVDYRGQFPNARDCSGCLTAFAFAAFAGIRPSEDGELGRLTWEDVSVENKNIRINATTSKTRTIRNIHIEPNLLAFIKAVPKELRFGKIVPGAWHSKKAQVTKIAGLNGKPDILRHSYGSYHLAQYGDINALGLNMGHKHMNTYFDHYHNARTTKEALAYWSIYPQGIEVKALKAI